MVIKRLLNFSDEEISVLVKAGEILGSAKKAFDDKEADELGSSEKELLDAIDTVLDEVRKN